ncbi:NAD(P)H-hydrate dehydratase [Neobacillus cucumis]|uniref:Bifunctional NAD(P)H-hydrate repair enzyme n=1 Tax=Neobacillus cucumis TaxID=1740721 RepID=A0A2N5HSN4_9BACI|nr:NAD(P)H-hydrate dehydratase [Neobacillus cucumis]PLS08535.1 bifunctional ADP-dependent NAD(P)H-hydrate dehydratase/NAD(P)H-hydrate epimerase [Neobacillus cucumis]
MFIAGQKEMQKMDQYTMDKLGLPGIVLMENAGAKVVEEMLKDLPCERPRILVLAGGGNNGGDGFVVARRLCDLGYDLQLCLLVPPEKMKGDAKIHFDVYRNRQLPILFLHESTLEKVQSEIQLADVIVDALLGTGISGPLREPFGDIISMVNEYAGEKLIVSVDIPSGVSGDSGKVEKTAVKATKTVTFVFPKSGFFLQDGPKFVGNWKAVDISVPPSIVEELGLVMPQLITEALVADSLPVRPKHGHKGTFGHVLVLGGSKFYVGAPIFSAKAALNSGAGLVTLALPKSIYPMAAAQNPESLFLPLADEEGHFSAESISELQPMLEQFKSIAIGPGISRFPGGETWMRSLMSLLTTQPVVIDADALYLLRDKLEMVREYKGSVVFTPHPGEMARLLNKTVKEVEEDRIEIAKTFSKDFGVYLLLKGHRSVIATPDGEVFINPLGHDALGKGGSGDVLTGIIAAFLAQGATPVKALAAASYLHARAGEEKARVLSSYGVGPLELVDGIREQLRRLKS